MSNYNSHAPATRGLEWYASRQIDDLLSSSLGRAAIVEVGTTETYNRLRAYMRTIAGQGSLSPNARYAVDIYDADDMHPADFGTAMSVPVADATTTPSSLGWHRSLDGSNVNLFQMIDDPLGVETGDYAYYDAAEGGPTGILRQEFSSTWVDVADGSTVTMSGKRILRVYVCMSVYVENPNPVEVRGLVNYVGTGGDLLLATEGGGRFGAAVLTNGTYTLCFTHADMAGFRSGQSFRPLDLDFLENGFWNGYAGVLATGLVAGAVGIRVLQLRVHADFCDEKRLATGWADGPISTQQWVEFALESPLDGSAVTLTKTSGDRLAVVFRTNPSTGAGNSIRSLDCANTVDHTRDRLAGIGMLDIPFDLAAGAWQGAGLPDTTIEVPVVADLPTFRTPGLVFYNGATLRTADTQPYVALGPFVTQPFLTHEQEFTPAATANYQDFAVVVKNDDNAHDLTAAFQAVVFRRSDNVQMGSIARVLLSDKLPPADNRYYEVRLRSTTAVNLVSGTQYYLRVGPEGLPGIICLALSVVDNAYATATQAGTTDIATIGGFGDGLGIDFEMTISQVPDPVAISGLLEFYPTDRGLAGACVVDRVPMTRLLFAKSAASDFAAYDIERQEQFTNAPWVRVAELPRQDITAWSDLECPRGVPVNYRIRVRQGSGATSDWSYLFLSFLGGTDTRITLPDVDEWALLLASNQAPRLTVATLDEEGYAWRPISQERKIEVAFYNRPGMFTFGEIERRGDRQTRRLIAAVNDLELIETPAEGGRAVFDAFALLEDATVPYVMMMDHRRRRWFTSPRVIEMTEHEPHGQYLVEAEFTDVDGPAPATASAYDYAGTVLPRGALNGWLVEFTQTIRQIVIIGDSIVEVAAGELGWPPILRASITTGVPLTLAGLGVTWNNHREWSETGTWTIPNGLTDQWDRDLWRQTKRSSAGTGAVREWTNPSISFAVKNVDIYWVDAPDGDDWSYSLNGGAWTAMGQTRLGDNQLKKFNVDLGGTTISSVRVRAATSGGAAAVIYCAGIHPHMDVASGFEIHEWGKSGDFIQTITRNSAGSPGDAFEIWDHVNPTLVILGTFSNDIVLETAGLPGLSKDTYAAALQTVIDSIPQPTDIIGLIPPEQDAPATRPVGLQYEYHQAFKDKLAENGYGWLDLAQIWGHFGEVAGVMVDTLHPSDDVGNPEIALRFWQILNEAATIA